MTKYLRYLNGAVPRYGRLEGTVIRPLDGEFPDLRATADPPLELSSVMLLAPTQPTRIVAAGPGFKVFFPDASQRPAMPMFWHKPLEALNHPEGVIELPTTEYPGINHEAELAIVIGRRAKCVKASEAPAYIFGYTCFNDVTRGDFYKEGAFSASPYYVYGKTYDGFAPIGPYVVTDLDISSLHIECRINGEVRQSHSTADMLFRPEQIVEWLSAMGTLNPGDVISMGSPPGLTWMKHGDVCEVEIENIGILRNYVRGRN